MEPMQKYSRRAHRKRKESELDLEDEIRKDVSLRNARSQGGKDRNLARTSESNDKVIEEIALLAETEKCQTEARQSGASPDLICGSHILSNITHELVEASNQRDSHGIPKETPWVFDINTNSINKLTKRILRLDPKRPPDESPVTLPTNRSFEEILESVINDPLHSRGGDIHR
eukprot:Gb_17649 [translate_table: standard]